MNKTINIVTCMAVMVLVLCSSCKKFLDAKPQQNFVIPSSLKDLQALLDDSNNMNFKGSGATEISADNYYLTDADYSAMSTEGYRRMYVWEKDFLFTPPIMTDWLDTYRPVNNANTVLDHLAKVQRTNDNAVQWDDIKGQALFFRSRFFFVAADTWAPAYNTVTATTDLGIPLRLNSDFNEVSVRSTVKENYERITTDITAAVDLLPLNVPSVTRPSRAAACGLLSRVYLAMQSYDSAFKYADLCLKLKNTLMDYNTINASATAPFAQFNTEVMFETYFGGTPLSSSRCKIDSSLMLSYAPNDLRKTVFFKNNNNGSYAFKGSYSNVALFGGIAVDEIYLTRAECYARKGEAGSAMNDLNTLLVKRWKTGTFVPLTAPSSMVALSIVLTERRKELLMRGSRWMDIKRLNVEGAGIVLKRIINGTTYVLPPNDVKYAMAIPEDVIAVSGIQQNPR